MINPGYITFRDVAIIHKLWDILCSRTSNPQQERKHMTISQELAGILTAAQALQAEIANPTVSILTTADQAQLDQVATVLGAPTSTSAAPSTTPVVSALAPVVPTALAPSAS